MLLLPVGLLLPPIVAAAAGLVLDGFPTSVRGAFSFRKLRTAYAGPCVRIRRGSDNAEQDFGFVNGLVDVAGILAFCGSSTGYVSKWRDQSGNGNDIYNTVAAYQPQVCANGSAILVNGVLVLSGQYVDNGVSFYIPLSTFSGLTSSTAVVGFQQNSERTGWAQITSSGQNSHTPWNDGNAYESYLATSRPGFGPYGSTPGGPTIHTAHNTGSTLSVFKNGTQIGSAQSAGFTDAPSVSRDNGGYGAVSLAEMIFTGAALSAANRQILERSMGTYFGVNVA